jgi:AcrR family transcriptional regulator
VSEDREATQRRKPRQARARATWDAIVEAAAQVLERDGLAGFNTTSVAERAGVSIGTLYQYFPDKQAILLAAAEREIGETPALASRQKVLMRALIEFLNTIGRMASPAPATRARHGHAKARPGGSGLDRRLFDWAADLGPGLQALMRELGLRPRLQPIPVRIRRRR